MQRNPYWPLNGPSFFSVPRFRRCVFSRSTKVAVGFGVKFRGADGKPTTDGCGSPIVQVD
jgi:hypothetical protein